MTSYSLYCLVPVLKGDGGDSAKVIQKGQLVTGFDFKSLFGPQAEQVVFFFLWEVTVTCGRDET